MCYELLGNEIPTTRYRVYGLNNLFFEKNEMKQGRIGDGLRRCGSDGAV
jgi:hypothetical protein